MAKGREQVEKLILEGDVTEGWPYITPPVTLLGKTCPAILEEEEAGCLRSMISGPLSQASVVKHAPKFAELAQKCIDEIIEGRFSDKGERPLIKQGDSRDTDGTHPRSGHEDLMNTSDSASSDSGERSHNIKLDALRSYTLDLMHGPVLNLKRDNRDNISTTASQHKHASSKSLINEDGEKAVHFEDNVTGKEDTEDELPSQELLLLWINRLKDGLCDIKFTYGPECMQLWRLNPYGRALNARKKLEAMLTAHVEEREKHVPVHHEKGRATRDPFSSAIPLWRLTENFFSRSEHPVMGYRKLKIADSNRSRARSENDLVPQMEVRDLPSTKAAAQPRFRTQSEPDILDVDSSRAVVKPRRKVIHSVLDQILGAADYEGQGITTVATTEMTLLIWMMMDAGQAWTSMALHLLSRHEDACNEVQAEIDMLENKYKDRLFTSFVLAKMEKLDNLIYEAMRFCPAFMGGLKTVNATIELDGVQVPKNSTVLLSNPVDDESFTINYDTPRKPEDMGMYYPSVDLYGFLPLQGLEIPIMVLQTKIFLIVLLQNYAPGLSGRRPNFVKRMTEKLSKSLRHIRSPSLNDVPLVAAGRSRSTDDLQAMEEGSSSRSAPSTPTRPKRRSDVSPPPTPSRLDTPKHVEIRHEERLFTNVPFPEPRREIQIRPRSDKIMFHASPGVNMTKPSIASRCITR